MKRLEFIFWSCFGSGSKVICISVSNSLRFPILQFKCMMERWWMYPWNQKKSLCKKTFLSQYCECSWFVTSKGCVMTVVAGSWLLFTIAWFRDEVLSGKTTRHGCTSWMPKKEIMILILGGNVFFNNSTTISIFASRNDNAHYFKSSFQRKPLRKRRVVLDKNCHIA